MNKKFLSAILFGALMVTSTGTFVSCKDYDEDIENLQTQIDKLATKDELTSQIASLQSALSTAAAEAAAAKTAAADALAKATAADKAAAQATLDAATAKADAIAAAKAEVAAAKAALEEAVDAKFENFQAELSATVAGLTAKVEKLTGLTTEMITSVEWQLGYDKDYGYFGDMSIDEGLIYYQLPYSQMPASWVVGGKEVKTITFGKDMAGALTLNAKETFAATDYALVAVNPANAVITDEMVSLINSKGQNLNDYVDIKVAPYKGLLTRAAAETGLYTVAVSLKKNVDAKKLAEMGLAEISENYNVSVRYALAVEKDGRVVTTPYAAMMSAYNETEGICKFGLKSTIKSSIKGASALVNYENFSSSVTTNNEWCYPVVGGEAFEIKTGSDCGKVLASYVTVDINNANLSTTDKAAINSLSFAGVNAVSQTGVHNITVTGATGVVIPLKVVAIGYNGYQVEQVVWVKAGNSSAITQTAAYVVTPSAYVAEPTAYAYSGKQAFTVPTGATKMEVSIYTKNEISIQFTQSGSVLNNSTLKFFKADGKTVATAVADVAVAQLNATLNLQTMKDDKVYEGTVKFYNSENTFLGQSAITIQKVLPTTLPAGFSVKTNQLNSENIYNCYLVPASWTANSDKDAVNNGTMDMDHVFNWGKGAAADYIVSFDAAKWDAANKKDVVNSLTGAEDLNVAKGYIDNKTTHATTVAYNYGKISTAKYDADKKVFNNYTIEAAAFNTVFNCIYNDTYSWRWATHEDLGHKKVDGVWNGSVINTELVYGTDVTVDVAANIQGISSRDGLYSAKFAAPYNNSLAIKEAHLVSDANNEVDEYFKVNYTVGGTAITGFTATQTSTETNPTAAVASTLVITAYDMYGHAVTIKLPMTVKTR